MLEEGGLQVGPQNGQGGEQPVGPPNSRHAPPTSRKSDPVRAAISAPFGMSFSTISFGRTPTSRSRCRHRRCRWSSTGPSSSYPRTGNRWEPCRRRCPTRALRCGLPSEPNEAALDRDQMGDGGARPFPDCAADGGRRRRRRRRSRGSPSPGTTVVTAHTALAQGASEMTVTGIPASTSPQASCPIPLRPSVSGEGGSPWRTKKPQVMPT